MAITVPNQWTSTASDADIELTTSPTAGRWLVAVITCRVIDGSMPTLNLGDFSRNLWTLASTPTTQASSPNASAQVQAEVWICPAVAYEGWKFLNVYAAVMQISAGDIGSVCINVFEVAGMANGSLTVDSVTLGTATAATSITLTAPAPSGSANCMMVACAGVDSGTTVNVTGTGWTGLTSATTTSPNVRLVGAWREATTTGGATFTLTSGTGNWAGVVIAFRTTGVTPAQPNVNWPATQFQVGHGYGLETPLSRVWWTDQTTRLRDLSGDRGLQAELGQAQEGQTDITIDSTDGAYSMRTPGSAAASATGTTTTIKILDANAVNINRSDFFRLATSGGALKEFTIFQVVSTSSAAGTTTVTFKRADGVAGGAQASTATGNLYVGVPIDMYTPYRLLMTWAGRTYVVTSGWLRDLPIVYDGAARALAQAEAVDALETLTAADISPLAGEILRRRPTHYWPLNDAAGSGYASNASGVSRDTLTQMTSKYGTGADASADFGASTQGVTLGPNVSYSLLGDQGTGWGQSGLTGAEITQKGYALVGTSASFPPIAAGVTVTGVLALDGDACTAIAAATSDPTIFILRNTDPALAVGQGSVLKVSIDSGITPLATITVWDKDTHVASTVAATINDFSSVRAWALTFNRTAWAFYVDGVVVAGGSCDLVASWTGIDVGGEADAFWHGHCFPGVSAHIAVFDRALTVGELTALAQAAHNGTPATEASSRRIRRKLNVVGWKGARIVSVASDALTAEGTPSGSVADITSEIAGYGDGLLFVDAAGQLQYRARELAYQQVPRAILGENVAGGEIPYQPGMSIAPAQPFVYNDVEIANTQGANLKDPQTSTFVAVDDASVTRYSIRTLPRATRFASDSDAWDMAWWYLSQYAYPQPRVDTVVIEAAAASARWPLVLGIEVGDIVTVVKRQLNTPVVSIRCRVIRVRPRIVYGQDGQVSGSVTLTLAAAPPVVTLLNDVSFGGPTAMGA